MKNTTKFGPTARLTDSFAHLAHASAAASAGDADFDFDTEEDDESDAEDEDEGDEDSDEDEGDEDSDEDEGSEDEDEGSEDDSDEEFEDEDDESSEDDSEDDSDEEFEDEGDDEDEGEGEDDGESDAEDDDTFEEEIDADDEDDTFEEVIADDEDEDEDTFEEVIADDEFEGEDDSEDEDEAPSEAEVIASLEAQGLCFVIASSEDEILESDMAEAVASLEDDEFEEVIADDEFEGEDDSEDDSEEDEESDYDVEDEDEESEDDSEEDDESDADEDEFEIESDDEGDEEDESDADDESEDDEFLAPVATEEFLASATADEVEFHLTDDPQNPVLNVIVASVPAARITLASFGAQASEMSSIFRSERYTEGLRTAMASQGVLNLLKKAHAEFYATAYRSSDIFEEAVASAEAVSTERVAVAMSGLREDFVDAVQLVSAGMDKNFFQIENPLKRALFIGMAHAGVMNPMEVIESAFAEASAAHFETVVEKAVEIMDKSVEAREELRAAIGESGVIDRAAGAGAAQASAIATAAVEESSAVAIAREVGARHTVSASSKNEQKDQIRGLFNAR